MKFKEIDTKYNVGDKLLHTYYSPGGGKYEEELIIQSINIIYGLISKNGHTKLDYYINYNCVRSDGMITSNGFTYTFAEGDWNEKYIKLIE